MRISWMGHSCFLIETDEGTKIITDPYEPGGYGGAVGYQPVRVKADVVTVSHQHADHNYVAPFAQAVVIDTLGKKAVKDVGIEGLRSFHDSQGGDLRGENIIYLIKAEGICLAHMGDLGGGDIDYNSLQAIDILFIPIGGTFTLDAKEAQAIISRIKPAITIPMHFKTECLGFGIDDAEKFLENREYEIFDSLEVDRKTLAKFKQIVILRHQR